VGSEAVDLPRLAITRDQRYIEVAQICKVLGFGFQRSFSLLPLPVPFFERTLCQILRSHDGGSHDGELIVEEALVLPR
jgi:hypothetical protein